MFRSSKPIWKCLLGSELLFTLLLWTSIVLAMWALISYCAYTLQDFYKDMPMTDEYDDDFVEIQNSLTTTTDLDEIRAAIAATDLVESAQASALRFCETLFTKHEDIGEDIPEVTVSSDVLGVQIEVDNWRLQCSVGGKVDIECLMIDPELAAAILTYGSVLIQNPA